MHSSFLKEHFNFHTMYFELFPVPPSPSSHAFPPNFGICLYLLSLLSLVCVAQLFIL